MRRFLILIIAIILCVGGYPQSLSPEQALLRCKSSLSAKSKIKKNIASAKFLKSVAGRKGVDCLYLFRSGAEDSCLFVVSADECALPLLGYGITPIDSLSGMPEAMTEWLKGYAEEISNAINSDVVTTDDSFEPDVRTASLGNIKPLIDSKWNQGDPYNLQCPVYSGKERCYTGCVATAAAQLMYKYKYPVKGVGSHSYTDDIRGQKINLSANFGATTYDWNSMTPTYSSQSSAASKNAVAKLMSHLGVAFDMDYDYLGINQSGTPLLTAGIALLKYFSYSKQAAYLKKSYYSNADWIKMVHDELAAGRPLIYEGDKNNSGHAFLCDGYDGNGNYFHFNWGWGGNGDGYYVLSALKPNVNAGEGGGNYDYTDNQAALFGLQKSMANDFYSATVMTYGDLVGTKTMFDYNTPISLKILNTPYNGFYNYVLKEGETSFVYALQLRSKNDNASYLLENPNKITVQHRSGIGLVSIPSFQSASIPEGDYTARLYVSVSEEGKKNNYKPVMIPEGNAKELNVHVGKYHVKMFNAKSDEYVLHGSNLSVPETVKANVEFQAKFSVKAECQDYSEPIYVKLIEANGNKVTVGKVDNVNIAKTATKSFALNCSLTDMRDTVATVVLTDKNNYVFYEGPIVHVENRAPELVILNSYYLKELMQGDSFKVKATIGVKYGTFSGKMRCVARNVKGNIVSVSDTLDLDLVNKATCDLQFNMPPINEGGIVELEVEDLNSDKTLSLPNPIKVLRCEFVVKNVEYPAIFMSDEYLKIDFDLSVSGDVGYSGDVNFSIVNNETGARYCSWSNFVPVTLKQNEEGKHVSFSRYLSNSTLELGPSSIWFFLPKGRFDEEGMIIGGPYPIMIGDYTGIRDAGYENYNHIRILREAPGKFVLSGVRCNEVINIYSIQGIRVLRVVAETDNPSIDVSSLSPGIYVLKSNDKVVKVKIY